MPRLTQMLSLKIARNLLPVRTVDPPPLAPPIRMLRLAPIATTKTMVWLKSTPKLRQRRPFWPRLTLRSSQSQSRRVAVRPAQNHPPRAAAAQAALLVAAETVMHRSLPRTRTACTAIMRMTWPRSTPILRLRLWPPSRKRPWAFSRTSWRRSASRRARSSWPSLARSRATIRSARWR